jgi:ankyrin repeat protein
VLAFRRRAFPGEIHDAARSGDVEKVQELLDKDPGLVSGRDDLSRTAPHYAADYGHRGVAQLLLAIKAEVDARDGLGGTPLHVAAVNGNRDVAELLRASKADVNAKTNRGPPPQGVNLTCGGGEALSALLVRF